MILDAIGYIHPVHFLNCFLWNEMAHLGYSSVDMILNLFSDQMM